MKHKITTVNASFSALTITDLNDAIGQAISNKNKQIIISNHNMHSLYIINKSPVMQSFYKHSSIIHIDGMLLIYLSNLLGNKLNKNYRVTYVDWTHPLISDAEKNGWKIYYLGSKPSIAEKAANILRQNYPALNIKTHHGYFSLTGEENEKVIEDIATYQPNILMVGMGMPRQEYWILDNLDKLDTNVILTSGACFDYVAGAIPTPPRWMGKVGLEWLYRLFSEPKRLWRRYLVEPWFLLPYIIKDIINHHIHKKSTMPD